LTKLLAVSLEFTYNFSHEEVASVKRIDAVLVAVTWSYFWNTFRTFSAGSASRPGRQFVKFFVISAVGLLIRRQSGATLPCQDGVPRV
jgi:hypothetical protein